jgi:hypothetical protein
MAPYVATLISSRSMPSVSDALVSIAMQELPKGRRVEILEPQVAADLYFDAENDAEADSFHAAILSSIKGSPAGRAPAEKTADRGYGFDHHPTGMHRRTC